MNYLKKKLKGAKEKSGSDIIIDKQLNDYAGVIISPAKLEKANKIAATLDLDKPVVDL